MATRSWTIKDGWLTAFSVTIHILLVIALVLMFFDPFDEKHFLRSLTVSETIEPLALCGAGILTAAVFVPLCISFARAHSHPEFRNSFPRYFPEEDGDRVVGPHTVLKFAGNTIFLAVAIGVMAYLGLRSYLPLILHDMGRVDHASVPFVIQSASYNKYCPGVTGDNPEFASRRLCGVKLNGAFTDYYGKDVILTGERSSYGFRPERYTLPDIPRSAQ
ncbi:hypothetical protein [Aureimonas jatrophae]|uniref:Uncharacterized protein n=1 Tax=Aureimonas jatrophae TaxID=1166073 RepID=A0A1H0GZG9_9HYPH|nr:hypothetical protein [Aureimonas jatrophae]MBB3949893.1 hypothetical protein [Aureimonas jatrophae]SDO12317.1 hypothetical protein SAMN05192530_103440 [Aureimonas jatrophae]